MVHARSLVLATLVAASAAVAGDPAAAEQPPAHHHGTASLQVSLDGRALQISFEGPSDNVLGFEHAPRTDAQKQVVARADQQLKQPGQLFGIPPAAQCQAQPARVDMKLPEAGAGETHSEIEAEWRWECGNPAALVDLDVGGLFRSFPRLRQVKADVVTARGQKTAVLKPGAARLKLSA